MTMPGLYQDVLFRPFLTAVRNCAAVQFALAARLPCRFPVTWNTIPPPADACDCTCTAGQGQAWVRLVNVNTGSGVTGAVNMSGGSCADTGYQITAELGVYRCWPVPEGEPLGEDEEEQAAAGLMLDTEVLLRSLNCCVAMDETEWQLMYVAPQAHWGGCTGVALQFRYTAFDCDCSDFSSLPPDMQQRVTDLQTTGNMT